MPEDKAEMVMAKLRLYAKEAIEVLKKNLDTDLMAAYPMIKLEFLFWMRDWNNEGIMTALGDFDREKPGAFGEAILDALFYQEDLSTGFLMASLIKRLIDTKDLETLRAFGVELELAITEAEKAKKAPVESA